MAPRRAYRRRAPMRRKPYVARKRKYTGRKRLQTTINMSRSLGPVAPRMITKMKYSDQFSLQSIAGAPAAITFNLNSIFDPDRSGTGHQPYGHDTYAALYHRYRVFGVSWRIAVCGDNANANNSYALTTVCIPVNGVSVFATPSHAMETPRAVTKLLNSTNTVVHKGHISLPRLNGSTVTQYKADDRFQALFGASPNELLTLQLLIAHPDASHTSACVINATLIYHVEVWDPLELSQS